MELSKHPDDQKRIRDEIAALKSRTSAHTAEFTVADLDSLAYTNAVIKVSYFAQILRHFHLKQVFFSRSPCVYTL